MIRINLDIRVLIITLCILFGIVVPNFVKADELQEAIRVLNNRNFETAYKMLAPLAEKGNAAAQLIVGMMYFKGKGIGNLGILNYAKV